ncbi:hypothetical protein FisN_2Lh456 [Fistulifera solaris]|uniref:Uncharacterized protein n=1 Tax=Fistulifera solaris TaxID=1519565 RepID=A0A1Z5JAD7_FISSO|nr:hypothetical protein FisN_2Lh456 [Fistulifera solaris]|eukprot:GAX10926.1 hypothetical protein FisN_2Lh456 [Fistulifera solaris]
MKNIIISAVLVLLTSATSSLGEVLELIDEPCQNYEETSTALQEAKAAWVDPPCYDFSYTFTGFQVGEPVPQAVQVRDGVAENGNKTMDDFFQMIESLCVENCPAEGAARCEVEYALEGYPMNIFIDIDQYQPDNRRTYAIENFAFIDCDDQEKPTNVPVTENPSEEPQETAAPSSAVVPGDEPTAIPTQGAPVDETITSSPTQMGTVDETKTNSPTQMTPVDENATNSPTSEATTSSPTAAATTSSPTPINSTSEFESRSTVVLNGFRISLTPVQQNSLNDTMLANIITDYLRADLEKLDGFLDVRLVAMDEDVTGQAGRQAPPYESRMFFGEAFFDGEAPEESAVLEIQNAALTDNTRIQKALDDGGVDAVLVETEIYEKETVGTEAPVASGAGRLRYTHLLSFVAAAASLSVVV